MYAPYYVVHIFCHILYSCKNAEKSCNFAIHLLLNTDFVRIILSYKRLFLYENGVVICEY